MDTLLPADYHQAIFTWFDQHGRHHLPWQKNKSIYSVWVSEIMLQQTQVSTVIPYYEKFMRRFPTVEALAGATEDDVLAHWSGLGYYSRARNLYQAANMIIENFNGQFPENLTAAMTLPGVGRSTASAILALTLNQPLAILDGNVKRVLARLFALPGYPGERAVEQMLWEKAQRLMPQARCADYTQAMMDLGATLCTRSKPLCHECPLHHCCIAHQQGNMDDYPGKKPKKSLPIKERYFLVLINPKGELFLRPRQDKRLWGGLWTTPIFKTKTQMRQWLQEHITTNYNTLDRLKARQHIFSHFKLIYTPVLLSLYDYPSIADGKWFSLATMNAVGTPKPIRDLFQEVENYTTFTQNTLDH